MSNFLLTIGTIFFMLFFLIPTFEAMFKTMNTSLPTITLILLTLSNFLVNNSLIIAVLVVFFILLVTYGLKNEEIRKKYLDVLVLKIPFLSNFIIQNILARFTLSMSTLLKSGVSLVDSLKLSKKVTTNAVFQADIDRITKKIIRGEKLSKNLQSSRFFDVTFVRLLVAGEESANLDEVFYLINQYYSKEFSYKLENLTTIFELKTLMGFHWSNCL